MPGMIKKRTYQPKEVLFNESSPATSLFLLTSGFVKLTTALPDGRSQVLRLGAVWQFLGIEALMDQQYPYRAEAATEVSVCVILYKDLLRVLAKNSSICLVLIEALNQELQRSNDMIRNLGLMSSTERIASFLLSMAQEESTPDRELPMPLSRKEMAEMLGLTLETVSRVIAKLMRDDVIDAPRCGGHFRILDHASLTAASGTCAGLRPVASEGRVSGSALLHLR
jgi:CRP/FNR family transcriptional regulator